MLGRCSVSELEFSIGGGVQYCCQYWHVGLEWDSMVEHLPHMYKVLGLSPCTENFFECLTKAKTWLNMIIFPKPVLFYLINLYYYYYYYYFGFL